MALPEVTVAPHLTLGLPTLVLAVFFSLFVFQVPLSNAQGCSSDISSRAQACFTSYSREYQNLVSSPQRLCCGIDVEILRAFCSSFNSAMVCIHGLRRMCPDARWSQIDPTNRILHGGAETLKDLCSNDKNIEDYARFQSCFYIGSRDTDECLDLHLNASGLKVFTVLDKSQKTLCSEMRGALKCVQLNVEKHCEGSTKAAELATKLVKLMVRQSSDCSYNITTPHPRGRKNERPSVDTHSADDETVYSYGNGASTIILPAVLLTLLSPLLILRIMRVTV